MEISVMAVVRLLATLFSRGMASPWEIRGFLIGLIVGITVLIIGLVK